MTPRCVELCLLAALCTVSGFRAPRPLPAKAQQGQAPSATAGDHQRLLQAVWTGRSYAYVLWPPPGVTAPPVLIDAGSDPAAVALEQALCKRNVALDAIEAVLLTHGHTNHTAGLKRMTRSAVYASFADAPLVRGDGPLKNLWLQVLQRLRAPQRQLRALHPLLAGQRLVLSGHTLEVVALPGHTAGGLGYAVLGGVIVGDGIYGPSLRTQHLRPYPTWAAQSPTVAAAVLARVNQAELAFVADGHTGISLR